MAEIVTLADLLTDSREAIDKVVKASTSGDERAALIDKAYAALGGAVQKEVAKACDQDIASLLAEGWSKAQALKAYADPEKYPPTVIARLVLAEHDQSITVDPQLRLKIGGVVVHELPLLVDFTVTLKAAVLVVQAGAIIAVELGSVVFAAKVRWGDFELPLPLKKRQVHFPGAKEFKPAWPISVR